MKDVKLTPVELKYLELHEEFPKWIDSHVSQVAEKLGTKNTHWLSKEQKAIIEEECRKLDEFCNELCASKADHVTAEKKAFGTNGNFYRECEKVRGEWQRQRESERRRKERELKRTEAKAEAEKKLKLEEKKPKEFNLQVNLHLEKGLTKRQRDELMANDFKRLKISPFGDSGAAYYWVRTNWHESKEHAFFCYIIESELKKYVEGVKVNYFDSPDVEFDFKNRRFCFEVETGTIMKRDLEYLEKKFKQLEGNYSKIYILVTSKKLKYKYSKYGEVVTRGTLRKTIAKFFRDHHAKKLGKA